MSKASSLAISMNLNWLGQARQLLDALTDEQYTTSPTGLAPHRASSQMRHVLEFYECLLNGIDRRLVNYDARRRDALLETNRQYAIARIENLTARLERLPAATLPLQTRLEDSPEGIYVASSLERELMSVASHTIHHFALIAIILRAHGVALHPDFGKAPSTITYELQRRAWAA